MRNEGFYYANTVPAKDKVYPLVANWADPRSTRFADIKSFLFGIMSGGGLLGVGVVLWFLSYVAVAAWRSVGDLPRAMVVASVFVAFVGSFSFDVFGLPEVWVTVGYLLSSESRKGVVDIVGGLKCGFPPRWRMDRALPRGLATDAKEENSLGMRWAFGAWPRHSRRTCPWDPLGWTTHRRPRLPG